MAIPYEPTSATLAMRNTPRFGHPNNFALLFGTKQQATDYFEGLIYAGVVCLAIFLFWSLVILVFKCMGPRRVGFLAGGPFIRPTDLTKEYKRPFIVRVIFLICGILVIVFSILFVTQGLTNIRSTVRTVQAGTSGLANITDTANSVFDSLLMTAESATGTRKTLRAFRNDPTFCLNNETVLEYLLNSTGENYSTWVTSAVAATAQLGDFLGNQTKDLQAVADSATTITDNANEQTQNIAIKDWQSLIILIPYIVFPTILLVGVVMAWFEKLNTRYRCLLTWFVLPIFVFQVFFAYLVSSLVMMGASGNADFCSGGQQVSPTGTITNILATQGYSEQDLEYQIALFYIEQCISQNPLAYLDEYATKLASSQNIIEVLSLSMIQSTNATSPVFPALESFCGDTVYAFQAAVTDMKNDVISLANDVLQLVELLRCSNVAPLYVTTFYGGTCTYSITGVTWCFSAFLVVGTMGLIMIMLRSAWQDVLDPAMAAEAKELNFEDEEYPEQVYPHMIPGSSSEYQEDYGVGDNETKPVDPYGDQSSFAESASAPYATTDHNDPEQATLASGSVYTSSPNRD